MKLLTAACAAMLVLSACSDYRFTARSQGGSVISRGAGYDIPSARESLNSGFSYATIERTCQRLSNRNAILGAALALPLPFAAGGFTTAQSLGIGVASAAGLGGLNKKTGFETCMDRNVGAGTVLDDNSSGAMMLDAEEQAIWRRLSTTQRQRVMLFIKEGSTLRSALME